MNYKSVITVFGFIFLTTGIVMFSDFHPSMKLWILRLLVFVVVQTLFVLSVLVLWRLNSGSGVFRLTLTSGSKIPAYVLSTVSVLVIFMSNFSILLFNLFYTANIPNLAKVAFFCLGIYVQCFLYQLFLTGISRLCVLSINRMNYIDNYKATVAKVQSVIFYLTIMFSFVMGIYGFMKASKPPVVEHVNINLKNFPQSMNDFKILMVSDVHFGMTVQKEHMDRITSIINLLDYDMLALIGDITDLPVPYARRLANPLKHLKPKYGKYFVTGNHEYFTGDVDDWLEYLSKELGVIVLRNEHVQIKEADDYFNLAGVDDVEARMLRIKNHGTNLKKALKGCDANHSVVLLAHQPRAAKEALDNYEVVELVLSGHTHGGQMLPMLFIVYLSNPFFAGLYEYKHGQVYVSQGAVYWGIPMRMFSQAEINVVHLFREN